MVRKYIINLDDPTGPQAVVFHIMTHCAAHGVPPENVMPMIADTLGCDGSAAGEVMQNMFRACRMLVAAEDEVRQTFKESRRDDG